MNYEAPEIGNMSPEQINARLSKLETAIRYQEPPDEQYPEFISLLGEIPILLSAPHGAAHTRDGKVKEEDEFTAAIVQLLAEYTGAYALFSQRKSNTDPNRQNDAPYKRTLEQIIRSNQIEFVMDIHGANESRPFGIALGTMDGESCPRQRGKIIQVFSDNSFILDQAGLNCLAVDIEGFKAKGVGTVTRFVATQLKVPAAQFELNAHLRIVERRIDMSTVKAPFQGRSEYIQKMIKTFIDLINVISNDLANELDEANMHRDSMRL
jgi:hypothetical protein